MGNSFLLAIFGYMNIQAIPCREVLKAIFATVVKGSREVNVLHVFPQVAPIVASLTTKGASVGLQSSLWSPHNILV